MIAMVQCNVKRKKKKVKKYLHLNDINMHKAFWRVEDVEAFKYMQNIS